MSYVVAFSGNIGAGKSTAVQKLSESPLSDILINALPSYLRNSRVYPFYEDFESEDLGEYYENPALHASRFQRRMFNFRLEREKLISNVKGISLVDRPIYEDRKIFGEVQRLENRMSMPEFKVYDHTYRLMIERISPPNLLVYLKADTSVLLSRIANRGRGEETSISWSYLDALNRLYGPFVESFPYCPVLVIDANQSVNDNPSYFEDIAHKIAGQISLFFGKRSNPGLDEWLSLSEVDATHKAIQSVRSLKEYLEDKPSLITVSGNVGLGKSTVTRILEGMLNINGLYEEPEKNPLLHDFLRDKAKYAFDLQKYLIGVRSTMQRQAKESRKSGIMDRSAPEDLLAFSKFLVGEGHLTSNQYADLTSLMERTCSETPTADLMLNLRGSSNTAWERILTRNRQLEVTGGWTFDEIHKLSELYQHYLRDVVDFGFHKGPVLDFDVDRVNCLDLVHLGYMCTEIQAQLEGQN